MGVLTKESAHANANSVLINLLLKDGSIPSDDQADQYINNQEAENEYWVADYLRGQSAVDILNYNSQQTGEDNDTPADPMDQMEAAMGLFGNQIQDGTVFLEDSWESLFSDGNYEQVPLLIGSNSEEMNLFLFLGFNKLGLGGISELTETFDPETSQLTAWDIVDNPIVYEFISLFASLSLDGTDQVASRVSNHQDVYAYEFRWDEEPEPFDTLLGAFHGIDVPFVFGNFLYDSIFNLSWSESNRSGREALSEAMMSYWANFAGTGDPNIGHDDLPIWEPWSNRLSSPKHIFDTGEIQMGR
jgi:para-nitrobenzyl esterase